MVGFLLAQIDNLRQAFCFFGQLLLLRLAADRWRFNDAGEANALRFRRSLWVWLEWTDYSDQLRNVRRVTRRLEQLRVYAVEPARGFYLRSLGLF